MTELRKEDIEKALSSRSLEIIGETADEMGAMCYVVGGFVRDLAMGKPSHDIDIVVTGAKGEDFARRAARKMRRKVAVYENFHTAQIRYNDEEIEIVGARKSNTQRNRQAEIEEGATLEEDLSRRDLTINAMAIGLNGDDKYRLIDYFDGMWDIQDRILATPLSPEVTFSDDPLRMLRAIRFATRLNFTIEDETFEAIEKLREKIKSIAQERITDEINKIILCETPSQGFELLFSSGLLEQTIPELYKLHGVEKMNGKAHKDNFFHTLEVLDNVAKATASYDDEKKLWLRWAALLHDIGKPKSKRWDPAIGWTFHNHNMIGEAITEQVFKKLMLPLDERMKFVKKLVLLHMRPIAIADEEVTDSAVRRLLFDAGDDIDDLMILCEADVTSKNETKKQRFLDNFKLVRQKLVTLEEKDRIRCFQPPVNGEEIMRTFSIGPCQAIGQIKEAIKNAILDGVIPNDHDAAYDFMMRKAADMGLEAKS